MRLFPAFLFSLLCLANDVEAAAAPKLFMRVIDVGPGLLCAIKSSDGHYMIYDAGRKLDNYRQLTNVIPKGSVIDLFVISHYDSDHIGAMKRIFTEFTVKTVLHNGMARDDNNPAEVATAVAGESGILDLNLARTNVEFGRVFNIGNVAATFVCGFSSPLPEWGLTDKGERNNAVSIVMRLDFGGRSILLCGDAVGRHRNSTDTNSIASERYMLDHKSSVPIKSRILVAPHHGADNGSSLAFIKAVDPKYVIFSAGHDFDHPTQVAVNRYLAAGVWELDMYRTDFGDCESIEEWDDGNSKGKDGIGDDDIDVTITSKGTTNVRYVTPRTRTKVPAGHRLARVPCE